MYASYYELFISRDANIPTKGNVHLSHSHLPAMISNFQVNVGPRPTMFKNNVSRNPFEE